MIEIKCTAIQDVDKKVCCYEQQLAEFYLSIKQKDYNLLKGKYKRMGQSKYKTLGQLLCVILTECKADLDFYYETKGEYECNIDLVLMLIMFNAIKYWKANLSDLTAKYNEIGKCIKLPKGYKLV